MSSVPPAGGTELKTNLLKLIRFKETIMKRFCLLLSVISLFALCLVFLSSCATELEAPKNLKLDMATQTLSWKKSAGAAGYTIVIGENEIVTRANSYSDNDEASSVGQFFHILGSVEQQNGCTFIDDPDLYEYTIYTSCYNTNKAILYYRTYHNSQITAVDLYRENLDSSELINYLLINEEQFNFIN
jgi:hypothetical protein